MVHILSLTVLIHPPELFGLYNELLLLSRVRKPIRTTSRTRISLFEAAFLTNVGWLHIFDC